MGNSLTQTPTDPSPLTSDHRDAAITITIAHRIARFFSRSTRAPVLLLGCSSSPVSSLLQQATGCAQDGFSFQVRVRARLFLVRLACLFVFRWCVFYSSLPCARPTYSPFLPLQPLPVPILKRKRRPTEKKSRDGYSRYSDYHQIQHPRDVRHITIAENASSSLVLLLYAVLPVKCQSCPAVFFGSLSQLAGDPSCIPRFSLPTT